MTCGAWSEAVLGIIIFCGCVGYAVVIVARAKVREIDARMQFKYGNGWEQRT